MQKLLQCQNYAIYKKTNGELMTQSGVVLHKQAYARVKSWATADHTVGYEENCEPGNFSFQRLSFMGEDKKVCTFSVSMKGQGNIPWCYVTGVYEKSNVIPNILKKVKPVFGSHMEEEDAGPSIERKEVHIYPTKQDKLGRIGQVTVISADKIESITKTGNTEITIGNKWVYNAFDLKIAYEDRTIKPKTVRLLPPNKDVIDAQVPRASGCTGREITSVVHDLLAKFGIDSEQIIQPKSRTMVKAEISR